VLACHDRAAQIDPADPVERLLRQLVEGLVSAPDADSDIIVQNVDAAPARLGCAYRGCQRAFIGHIGFERNAFSPLRRRHCGALLRRADYSVDGEDACTLLCKPRRCCTTVADPLARALPGADDHRDLAFEAHRGLHCDAAGACRLPTRWTSRPRPPQGGAHGFDIPL